ncbi:hypothetical protein ASZ90_016365 [hydrocarbon metagenome]|uniref:Uncharacterized protein n=1 Tax=hydrocarbon metagenome TaxID=938273 RepID=A0A0W8EXQ9_9ZZZZ
MLSSRGFPRAAPGIVLTSPASPLCASVPACILPWQINRDADAVKLRCGRDRVYEQELPV